MATLIFDIQTIGEDWEMIDEVTQSMLTRRIDETALLETEYFTRLQELQCSLSFSPLTARIVSIGVYDVTRSQGAVYYTGFGAEKDEQVGTYVLKQRTEKEMLSEFWEGARSYDTFVTFNGRRFDTPFLLHRSVVHGIVPTRNLMEGRYPHQQKTVKHVDLQDQFNFFGTMKGCTNMHLYCRAYGVASPERDGVSGADISNLYEAEQYKAIALYNSRIVTATAELHKKWQKYLVLQ